MAKNNKYLIERDLEKPVLNVDEIELVEKLANYQKAILTISKKGYTATNLRDLIDKVNDVLILSNEYMIKLRVPEDAVNESYERRFRKLIKE